MGELILPRRQFLAGLAAAFAAPAIVKAASLMPISARVLRPTVATVMSTMRPRLDLGDIISMNGQQYTVTAVSTVADSDSFLIARVAEAVSLCGREILRFT